MADLYFRTEALKVRLEAHCLRVLEHFELPALKLLCFFDDENPQCFAVLGPYRGFQMPVKGSGYFPPYIRRLFFDSRGGIAFDNVIYVPGSTSAFTTGTVITFAHELEHFVQYGTAYKVWVSNTLLYKHLPTFEPTTTAKAWDIPHEQDAMIVSKRVAGVVVGTDVVSAYAASRIADNDDVLYWKYFEGLPSAGSFGLLTETIPWVDRYRPQLIGLRQSEVDFSKVEWWQ